MPKLTAKEQARLDELLAKAGAGPAPELADVDGPSASTMAETYANMNREQRRALEAQVDADGTFCVSRKTFRLTFENTDLAGLWVRARSLPIGTLLSLMGLAGQVEAGAQAMKAEDMKVVTDLFDGFAEALVGWNLTNPAVNDNGEEIPGQRVRVPPTTEGMLTQDTDFIMPVIMAWLEAAAGVGTTLGKGLSSGGTLPGGSMPMETPSPNLPS